MLDSIHITPLLYQLHRLKAPERIEFKLAVLTNTRWSEKRIPMQIYFGITSVIQHRF